MISRGPPNSVAFFSSPHLPCECDAARGYVADIPPPNTFSRHRRTLITSNRAPSKTISMRNKFSDAHGRGGADAEAAVRHARLAANAACTVALFLIESHLAAGQQAVDGCA